MATITTTKRALGDDTLVNAVAFSLAEASAELDTVGKRLVVQTNCRFSLSMGGQMSSSKTTMVTDHDGLTTAEKQTLLTLLGKIYNYDLDNDPLA